MAEERNTNTPSENAANTGQGAPKRSGRGSNLSNADRSRGGQRSAQLQKRDASGQFAGRLADEEAQRRNREDQNRGGGGSSGGGGGGGGSGSMNTNQAPETANREGQNR